MPLGVLKESDFEIELNKLGIVHGGNYNYDEAEMRAPEVNYIEIKHGRGSKLETPEPLRAEIAEAAIAGVNVDVLAKEFDISKSSISAYKNGATSTSSYNDPNKELKEKNDLVKHTITKSATAKLQEAIKAIDLSGELKPNIASAVARDMATIVDKMNPQAGVEINNNKVIIYKPRMREEDSYEILDIVE